MHRALQALILTYVALWAANRSQVRVAGWSMAPALWPGDRLLTVPVPTPLVSRALRAGDVVVVRDPHHVGEGHHLVVKRVATIDAAGIDVGGDDPARSTDSRTWGPLPPASVRRRVLRRLPDWRTPLHRPGR